MTEDAPTDSGNSLPPNTTAQEDIVTGRQSRINLIWEITQSLIAIMVTGSTMYVSIFLSLHERGGETLPTILGVAFGMITGFYFARTNHQRIGGIGQKANENQEYKGR